MDQRGLEEAAEVDHNTICGIETRRIKAPTYNVIARLLKVVGKEWTSLFAERHFNKMVAKYEDKWIKILKKTEYVLNGEKTSTR